MKVNFEYTKDEYKKYLIKSRLWNNIGLFIFGVVLYLILSYDKVSLIYLPLVLAGLIVLIILLKKNITKEKKNKNKINDKYPSSII